MVGLARLFSYQRLQGPQFHTQFHPLRVDIDITLLKSSSFLFVSLSFFKPKNTANMEETKTVPVALTETRSLDAFKHDPDHIEEVVIARLTEEEIFRMSEEAFSWKSKAALRIVGVMFVQGCNQAGYGVDWGVISGIVRNKKLKALHLVADTE